MIEGLNKGLAYGILFGSYIISILALPYIKNIISGFIPNPILLFFASYGMGFALMIFLIPKIVTILMGEKNENKSKKIL